MSDNSDGELVDVRCRVCGTLLDYKTYHRAHSMWCSETCVQTPMSKYPDAQIRDEVVAELALHGVGIGAIVAETETPYQMIQYVLGRRGITPAVRGRHEPGAVGLRLPRRALRVRHGDT